MRQHTIAIVGVVCIALVAGVGVVTALDGPGQNQHRSTTDPQDSSRTITVSASGGAAASPNQVQIRLSVVATNESAPAARRSLAENVSQMRTALEGIGIGDDQIRTSEYSLGYEEDRLRYRAEHTFTVTVDNLNTAGQVIDTAVNNGADRVDDVQFTLTEAQRRSLRTQALEQAMTSAQRQAETLANQSGLTITGVYSVQKSTNVDRPRFEVTYSAADAGTELEGGPVGMRATVKVIYNATPA